MFLNLQKKAVLFPFDPDNSEHQQIIKHIEQIRERLTKLQIELEGGAGLFKWLNHQNDCQIIIKPLLAN